MEPPKKGGLEDLGSMLIVRGVEEHFFYSLLFPGGKTQDVSMISGSGQFFYGKSIRELYSFLGFLFGFSPKPRTMDAAWQQNIPIGSTGSMRLAYLPTCG